jgi:hypothetical protein
MICRFLNGMGLGFVLATTSVYIVEIATTGKTLHFHDFAWNGLKRLARLCMMACFSITWNDLAWFCMVLGMLW